MQETIQDFEDSEQTKAVHLISLGCARNRVDSEVMLGDLFKEGWIYAPTQQEADVVIVNTCGFINAAKEESINTILEVAGGRKENPDLKVVVAGCLAQRYKKQLAKALPEVDFFIGTSEFSRLPALLAEPPAPGAVFSRQTGYLYEGVRINTLSKVSAYVKVAEGCQHNCSFCIIPAIRGPLRSRNVDSVVKEVQNLVGDGVVEINLIAQDLAAFGRDTGTDRLLELLQNLVKVEGLRWIRLLYVYPENISDELLQFIASQDKIVKYFDIPVQHASDPILKKMNRVLNREELKAVFKRVRAQIPGVSLRTSVMAGFPGETEEDFHQLRDFVQDMRFEHLGCFSYSQEEGTVAGRMKDQVNDDDKARRQAAIMDLQRSISAANLQSKIGSTFPVIIEGPYTQSDEYNWVGRLAGQAPEVDGKVLIKSAHCPTEAIQTVTISSALEYDLVGSFVD